ncbi:MAG: lipopolysaccharide biosynthesis protein [Calditrichaeota bacterium]|nr:MAG: lipopolysaccharide biosynthesis protein [Calditrichota bacterium]
MSLKEKTRAGIIWTSATIMFSKSIHIIAGIILARILFPEDFGLYAMAVLVKKFGKRLTQLGFGAAIIQQKEITKDHINTVFTITIIINSLVIGILYFASPFIGVLLENENVVPVIRVISLSFLFLAFTNVAEAILKRDMKFKDVSLAVGGDSFVSLLTPIPLALAGLGVWSMVFADLLGAIVRMIIALWKSRWLPKLMMRVSIFKELFSYGFKVSIVTYLDYFVSNVDYMLIGTFLGMAPLGYYERAFNTMNLTRKQLQRAMNEALFSAYSKIKDEPQHVVKNLKNILSYVSFVGYPVLIWLFFAAPSLITQLYGERWIPTIEPLQIMCLSGLLNTLIIVFFPVIFAVDLLMQRIKMQLLFLLILIGTIYFALPYGIVGVSYATVISYAIYLVLILSVIIRNLPFSLKDFFQTQQGPFIYGGIQITVLFSMVYFLDGLVAVDSILMLFLLSFGSLVSLGLTHLILKNNDAQAFLEELMVLMGKVKNLKPKSST